MPEDDFCPHIQNHDDAVVLNTHANCTMGASQKHNVFGWAARNSTVPLQNTCFNVPKSIYFTAHEDDSNTTTETPVSWNT